MPLLRLDSVHLQYGTQVLLDDVSLSITRGEKLGLLGRNGTGKTTLLKLLAGELTADSGERWVRPGVRIARLQQTLPEADQVTVYDAVAAGLADAGRLLSEYHHLILADPPADMEVLSRVQQQLEAADGWQLQQRVETTISQLQLPAEATMSELSGGWRRRVALAQALVSQPDILLLDEPTNHLDIPAIRWLEEQLANFAGAIILITHDRRFLQNVANSIAELDRGHLTQWRGDYQGFLRHREQQLLAEERANELFDKKLAQEEVWIRQGIKARRTRNEGRVRALEAMRNERQSRRERIGSANFGVEGAARSGKIVAELEHVDKSFGDLRVLQEDRRKLRNETGYINELVHGIDPLQADSIRDDLAELVSSRRALIRQAIELETTYAQELGDLDFTLRSYAETVDRYRNFISARLLWLPSRDMFGLFTGADLASMVDQVSEVFAPGRWLIVVQAMPAELLAQPFIGAVILLGLLLVYYSPRLKRQLAETGKNVGYVRTDNFASTLHALGLTLLLSMKWPMLLMSIAWLFEMQDFESELATALFVPSVRATFYLWGLEFLRIALLPKGLVDKHFRWPTKLASQIGRRIVMLELTLLPAAFMVGFFLQLYPREVGGPLGTLAVILVLFSIANFFRTLPQFVQSKMQLMFREGQSTDSPLWGTLLRKLLFWIPVWSILAVFLGYSFTAIEVALLLIRTFVLLSCVMILHELGLRWLGITRRRMAFKVRQEHAKSGSDDGETRVEEELLENDPELLNDEGTKLVNLLTLISGLLGVALIWAEVVPALGILDSVELWHQAGVVDGREVPVPVTLADLGRALVIAIVGWVALRRIPSLLEILLRQRANVRPASAYAISRMLQYAGTTLLVVILVSSMGGSWSSMQWAVAALSLGIGFGLQEIVANFISGLIILFEQPIRLGDVVTVGEISGTVTKIQIRATTIRDFDRRELLVPNKEFITNQLLNWSLSDPVTRRLIQVGVAYGTDMDKALAIVGDVAKKHPLVMADPVSMITFDEFGDNSLLISLRYFLDQLDRRLQVDSELRLEINRRFNEAGIVVAFPQRDVHLDAAQPLEIRMVDGGSGV